MGFFVPARLTEGTFKKQVKAGLFTSYVAHHITIVLKDHVKALVWFWIIDETLVLTSILSVCRLNEVGTCQVMEQVMIMVMMVMTTR